MSVDQWRSKINRSLTPLRLDIVAIGKQMGPADKKDSTQPYEGLSIENLGTDTQRMVDYDK